MKYVCLQGRAAEAEPYFVKALAAAKTGFGEQDPHVAAACNNLAELLRLRKLYTEAAPFYEQVLHSCVTWGKTDSQRLAMRRELPLTSPHLS